MYIKILRFPNEDKYFLERQITAIIKVDAKSTLKSIIKFDFSK